MISAAAPPTAIHACNIRVNGRRWRESIAGQTEMWRATEEERGRAAETKGKGSGGEESDHAFVEADDATGDYQGPL